MASTSNGTPEHSAPKPLDGAFTVSSTELQKQEAPNSNTVSNKIQPVSDRNAGLVVRRRAAVIEDSDDDDNSSVSESFVNLADHDGWDDAESDTEKLEFKSLIDEQIFSDLSAVLEYDRTKWNIDLVKLRADFELDFLGTVQLINYIRFEAQKGITTPDLSSKDLFIDSRFLQPTMEDDALLFSMDDVDEPITSDPKHAEAFEAAKREILRLRAQVESMQQENSGLRAQMDAVKHHMHQMTAVLDFSPNEDKDIDQIAASIPAMPKKSREIKAPSDAYYHTYSGNEIHETMLKDHIRTGAYRNFIEQNAHLFKDKIVLDVGCGSGILSMMCAKAGAKLVIAVDNAEILSVAQENAFTNGLDGIIKFVHGEIETVDLPVKEVDIIISEWMGYALHFEGMLRSVLIARDRYLTPNGLMVPSHTTVHLAAVSHAEFRHKHVDFWHDVYGFDLSAHARRAQHDALVLDMDASVIASPAQTVLRHDLRRMSVNDMLGWRKDFTLTLDRDVATLDGFALWFDMYFTPNGRLVGDIRRSADAPSDMVTFSTGPHTPATHWMQTFLPVFRPSTRSRSSTSTSTTNGTTHGNAGTNGIGNGVVMNGNGSGSGNGHNVMTPGTSDKARNAQALPRESVIMGTFGYEAMPADPRAVAFEASWSALPASDGPADHQSERGKQVWYMT